MKTTITYETARGASVDAAMIALVGLWATVKTSDGRTTEVLVESYDEIHQILMGACVVDGLPIGASWSAQIDSVVSIEV